MRKIAFAALILISCGSTFTASPTASAQTSLAATPGPASEACPVTYPWSNIHAEPVWSGRAKILSIESVSDELFTATLVGSDPFTTNPLRLHFNDAGKHHLASFAVQAGDLVDIRLASRGDDCSYQVTLMAKVP